MFIVYRHCRLFVSFVSVCVLIIMSVCRSVNLLLRFPVVQGQTSL